MSTIVGSGKYTYEVNDDWAKLPEGWQMPAAAVTVDSHDRVYCFNRTPDHPIVVFDRDGNYLSSWGAGLFKFPHTIRADAADNLWIVDRDHAQMLLYTSTSTAVVYPLLLDASLFELLQREAWLSSCELSPDASREELVGWRLVGRTPDLYAAAVVESVLERGGFDPGLGHIFRRTGDAGSAGAPARGVSR